VQYKFSVGVWHVKTGYLGLTGGVNVKTTTTAVMKSLMTTEVAKCYNFYGHRGKRGFAALQLKEVVCGWCSVSNCNFRTLFIAALCE